MEGIRQKLQAVGVHIKIVTRHYKRVYQIRIFDSAREFAIFVIEELQIELRVVTDDDRVF